MDCLHCQNAIPGTVRVCACYGAAATPTAPVIPQPGGNRGMELESLARYERALTVGCPRADVERRGSVMEAAGAGVKGEAQL